MSESGERRGLQISLKWFLIGVPLAGATLGLLGRSFYRDPNEFRLALMLVTVVAPFVLLVGTVVRLGWRSGNRILIAWGVLLLVAPFFGYGMMRLADHLYGAHGYGIVDNTTLIRQRLPNELMMPWVWQELEQRLQRGSLSQVEVNEVLQALASHMKANNQQGWNQPLHWQGSFIKLAVQKQLVAQQTLFDFCDAFYGSKPALDHFSGMPGFQGDHRIGVEFGNQWGFPSDLPVNLVWFPSNVLVDGKPVKFTTSMSHGDDWDGEFFGKFSDGDHDLTVELECAYVDNQSSAPWDSGCIERSKWPKQLHKTWSAAVTEKRNFMGSGMGMGMLRRSGPFVGSNAAQMPDVEPVQQAITLSSRAADDPLANKAVEIPRITIAPGRNDVSAASLMVLVNDNLSIPISCDVTAKIGDKMFAFGTYVAGNMGKRKFRSAGGYETHIGGVAHDVDTAEVTLTPNPKHVQQSMGVTEIWGKPIVLKDVPIERSGLGKGGL